MKGDSKVDDAVKSAADKPKIEEIRPDEDDDSQSCRTFVIHNEDHTLGNSLRYELQCYLLMFKLSYFSLVLYKK